MFILSLAEPFFWIVLCEIREERCVFCIWPTLDNQSISVIQLGSAGQSFELFCGPWTSECGKDVSVSCAVL